jgi:hypothetical protein
MNYQELISQIKYKGTISSSVLYAIISETFDKKTADLLEWKTFENQNYIEVPDPKSSVIEDYMLKQRHVISNIQLINSKLDNFIRIITISNTYQIIMTVANSNIKYYLQIN